MHSDQTEAYAFVAETQTDNQFLRYLRNILNEYNHSAAAVAPLQTKSFCTYNHLWISGIVVLSTIGIRDCWKA